MNRNKRVRGTKEIVVDILLEHPDWNARQVYDRYKLLLGDSRKVVTLSAIQKQIENINPILETAKKEGLDNVWSMNTLKEHPLPPDVIPILLRIKKNIPALPLTIRIAIWVSRFYTTIEPQSADNAVNLFRIAYLYALNEARCTVLDIEFNTEQIDDINPSEILKNLQKYSEFIHQKKEGR
jgi:hypothetical protein